VVNSSTSLPPVFLLFFVGFRESFVLGSLW